MNNTKNKPIKQHQKSQSKTRHGNATKKQSRNGHMLHHQSKYHEQERIETRMFD